MAYRAGIVYDGENEPLAPVSHIMARAQIEITLDQDGRFVSARTTAKEEPKIIIPVTEESAGRTSAPCAHPLCDQLGYVSPYDAKKHALYAAYLNLCVRRHNSVRFVRVRHSFLDCRGRSKR